MTRFEEEFNADAQLTDFTGNQITFKLPHAAGKSIGFLFGFIQALKDSGKYAFREFSAEMTSLE